MPCSGRQPANYEVFYAFEYNFQHGNDIELRPLGSRLLRRATFTVHEGDAGAGGELRFLEVRDDGLVLRSTQGMMSFQWCMALAMIGLKRLGHGCCDAHRSPFTSDGGNCEIRS